MSKGKLSVQTMINCTVTGALLIERYVRVVNTWFRGNVVLNGALTEGRPGLYGCQFDAITWQGALILETSSNFYFVSAGATLVGAKTVLFSLA